MSKTYTVLTFKGICMNFLLELKIFILSHPVTSKQPPEIVFLRNFPPSSFTAMSCKLATLIKLRKHGKFFANQGLSLPPLAADSFRGLYSKVLQCALLYELPLNPKGKNFF